MFGFEILTVRSISCRGMMLALLLCHLGCSKLPSQLLDGSSITCHVVLYCLVGTATAKLAGNVASAFTVPWHPMWHFVGT